nr:hypothetical protein [uncultured Acetatifactor sp.]
MVYQAGYVYHIKDEYFEKANGTYRPTFYCVKDEKTSLLWMVPLSSRVDKFQALHDRQVQKYGRCLTIILGEFDGRRAAFLLQNMFPVTEYYLDHIHTRNSNPVPVRHSIHREIITNIKRIRQLHARSKKVVFPDITRLEKLMLEELEDRLPLQAQSPASDPFYSESNMAQLQKAAQQAANGQVITKTMKELEGMEREPE